MGVILIAEIVVIVIFVGFRPMSVVDTQSRLENLKNELIASKRIETK